MNYIYTAYFYTTTIFEYSRDIYDNLRSATAYITMHPGMFCRVFPFREIPWESFPSLA